MADLPEVKPGYEIHFGNHQTAIVCSVNSEPSLNDAVIVAVIDPTNPASYALAYKNGW